ncbi:hypothetical protein [Desulfacinum hydrothermale]|nr:hypothetical protein [Desulfacinum hydrothermale]
MATHQMVVLEEPPHPSFQAMLDGRMDVQEYLEETEYEFPVFAQASCRLYRRLYEAGIEIVQVEPYLEALVALHEFFAEGGDSSALAPESLEARVHKVERRAFGTLLNYYRRSMDGDFPSVVQAVKDFARADAVRIKLRDAMRARAVARLARRTGRLYVEAGYIHWALYTDLRKEVEDPSRVRALWPLEALARRLVGKKQVLGPGDLLTLCYVFHPRWEGAKADELAAKSLIYVKLLEKKEMAPGRIRAPHLWDEARAWRAVRPLGYEECRLLWPEVRRASTAQAWKAVRRFLERRKG